jgi:hypothetical protein
MDRERDARDDQRGHEQARGGDVLEPPATRLLLDDDAA